jgi:hypothetical protein
MHADAGGVFEPNTPHH